MLYADTSALVSYYVTDANSANASALINSASEPLAITALHHLELRNALELAVFRRQISRAQAEAARKDILRDIRTGLLIPADLDWESVFRRSASLARRHSSAVGSRSLDILHVASAKELGIQQFYTFDDRQKKLAVAQGMAVHP